MKLEVIKNKYKLFLIVLLSIFVCGLFFSYGFLSYHYQIMPYNFVKQFHTYFTHQTIEIPNAQNISKLIQIENETDLYMKRNKLINYIWKNESIPDSKLPEIEKNISDERYSDMYNLKRIDKLTVKMEYNISSIMYHFQSKKHNNKLIIYHQGHSGDFIQGKEVIQEFLNNGYDVIGISMPLLGLNNQPEIELERFGKVKFTSHNHFKLLDNSSFSSIKFFIEPVIASVNYAQKLNFNDTYMTGISGGGWTTVLSSAIDDRISISYPIAGSYPILFRSSNYGESFGDYEQTEIGMYKIVNYLELYILGSYGDDRRQVQIFNIYDSCCFKGEKYSLYEESVSERIYELGKGEFSIFADDTHYEHKISGNVLNFIINDLNKD